MFKAMALNECVKDYVCVEIFINFAQLKRH